jgi:cobalamin biosynthesis protein CbiG
MSLVVGIGLRAGTPYRELRGLVDDALEDIGGTVVLVVTRVGRENEHALRQLVEELGSELRVMTTEQLAEQSVPSPSAQVEHLTGTASVAEAAVLALNAQLVVQKLRSEHATVAIGLLSHPG